MMEDLERLRQRSIRKLSDEDALIHIANLIDQSHDANFIRGADRALYLLNELRERSLTSAQVVLSHYFEANAWAAKSAISGQKSTWDWELPNLQSEILCLSRAATHAGFSELDNVRQCQILTNRANLLSNVGRIIDAIEGWDDALRILPNFAMARGNRGSGLEHYARSAYDPGHKQRLLLHAYDSSVAANAADATYDCAYPKEVSRGFKERAAYIAGHLDVESVRAQENLDDYSLGRSKREHQYRRWCLDRRLFINPMNDLGAHAIAAYDVLTLPNIIEPVNLSEPTHGVPPPIIGYFNQLKQEFVSARFALFEGITSGSVHFSDRGVRLYNTLDYPCYSLAVERVRTSYRVAYSLLDKIAFFVNAYWRLGHDERTIYFKTVWYDPEKPSQLHARFIDHRNWPLRGLFWLSKELFDERLKQATSADARELHDIRNHLEHKFLSVHEWAGAGVRKHPDTLAYQIPISELEAKALRVTKLVRAALIYLSLAVHQEENLRSDPNAISIPLHLGEWDDRWKRR